MAQGKIKIAGHNDWRDVAYTLLNGEVVITDPPGLISFISDREVHIQLEDGAIRRGFAHSGGHVVFTR